MVDVRVTKNSQIYNEFDEVENTYWFDFKKSKFLHNIDTFYYSVKFKQDFTADSSDLAVKRFRRYFSHLNDQGTERAGRACCKSNVLLYCSSGQGETE